VFGGTDGCLHCERVSKIAERALINSSNNRDTGLTQNMGDLRVAQARSVVFESELVLLLIDAKPAQPISVSEFAKAVQLLKAERRLQFVGDFDQGHGWGL
jgi:hypothetical protein